MWEGSGWEGVATSEVGMKASQDYVDGWHTHTAAGRLQW